MNRRTLLLGTGAALGAGLVHARGAMAQSVTITGAGATFPRPVYERWANAARTAAPDARRRQHRHGLPVAQAPVVQTTPAGTRQAGTTMALATAVLGPLPNPIVSIVLLPPGGRATVRGVPVDARQAPAGRFASPAAHARGQPGAALAQTHRRSPRLAVIAPPSSAGRPTLG